MRLCGLSSGFESPLRYDKGLASISGRCACKVFLCISFSSGALGSIWLTLAQSLKIYRIAYCHLLISFFIPVEIIYIFGDRDVGMPHLGSYKFLIDTAAQQNAGVCFSDFMSTSFRNTNFFTSTMQPSVEPFRPDPAQLIHKYVLPEWMLRPDRL